MAGLVDFLEIASDARRRQLEDILYELQGKYEYPERIEADYDDIETIAHEMLEYDQKLRRHQRKKQITLACCLKYTGLPIEMQLHILSYTEAPIHRDDWIESKHSPLGTALKTLECDYGGPRENNLDMVTNTMMRAFPWFDLSPSKSQRLVALLMALLRPQKKTATLFMSLVHCVYYYKQADAVLELGQWMLERYPQDCIGDPHEVDLCILDMIDWNGFDRVRKPLLKTLAALGHTTLCQFITKYCLFD